METISNQKLKILELREKAQNALKDTFDLKEFHRVILENGGMPLDILEQVVDKYIDKTMNRCVLHSSAEVHIHGANIPVSFVSGTANFATSAVTFASRIGVKCILDIQSKFFFFFCFYLFLVLG